MIGYNYRFVCIMYVLFACQLAFGMEYLSKICCLSAKKNYTVRVEEINPLEEEKKSQEIAALHDEFYVLQQDFGVPPKRPFDGYVFKWAQNPTIETIAPWNWEKNSILMNLATNNDFVVDFFFCCLNRKKPYLATWVVGTYPIHINIQESSNSQLKRRIEQIGNAIHNIAATSTIDDMLLIKSLSVVFNMLESGVVMCKMLPDLKQRFKQHDRALNIIKTICDVGHQKRTGLKLCVNKQLCDVVIQHKNL